MNISIQYFSILLIAFIFPFNLQAGYGDCFDTLPNAFEREVHVMTNAVRMDPAGFRDKYISGTNILQSTNYPPIPPLWYNNDLSRAARFHVVDMAFNCGMKHESCDGTAFNVRLNTFYKSSSRIGENVATGKTTGLQTVVQWLRDEISQGTPAPDKDTQGRDGHRRNMMDSLYKEIGIGYAYNASRQWNYFWVQDFGGGAPATYKIPAGCHFSASSTTISFAANFYDKSGNPPKTATVFVDNTTFPMTLYLGKAAQGTYIYTTTKDQEVHCYHFEFTDNSGNVIRFPETTQLTTGTSLSCTSNAVYSTPLFSHVTKLKNIKSVQQSYMLNGIKMSGKISLYHGLGVVISERKTRSTVGLK